MIEKPKNWDSLKDDPNDYFKAPEPGAYLCKIVGANKQTSKSGKPMLVVDLDIDDDSEFDGYFGKEEAIKLGRGWKNIKWSLSRYLILDFNDRKTGNFFAATFKKFLTDVELSNKGFKFDFDNEHSLVGKKVPALIIIVQYINEKGQNRQFYQVHTTYTLEQFLAGDVDDAWFVTPDKEKVIVKKVPTNTAEPDHEGLFGNPDDIPFD